jgi:hypothetical protein
MSTSDTNDLEIKPTFHRSLQALIDRADAPTGMLVMLAGGVFDGAMLRDGLTYADAVDQRQWENIYAALAQSRLPHAALEFEPMDVLPAARAEESAPVSIGLINVRYQRATRRLAERILRAERDDAEIDIPEGPLFEERTAFSASALLPPRYWGFERQSDIHAGLDVEFHLDPARFVSNAGDAERIEIDFDDGNGFRELSVGGWQAVHYESDGEHHIALRALYGQEWRSATFLFRAEAVTAPLSNYPGFDVEAKIGHGPRDVKHWCHVEVYLGKGNTQITRPFVVAEGFPGGALTSDLYDRLNGRVSAGGPFNPNAQLADALRENGYDILFMSFPKWGEQLQGNAYAYLAALLEIWTRMGSKGAIVAAGASMGGLIARYALAYANTRTVPIRIGNVTTLMTFDSPHLGANVPYAIQCVVRYFRGRGSPAIERTIDLLNRPAAKQMLMAQRWADDNNDTAWVKDDFRKFYGELGGFNNGGYPTNVKKYAVCNGAGDGRSFVGPHAVAVRWNGGCAGAWTWTATNGASNTPKNVAECRAGLDVRHFNDKGSDGYGRDSVAGGTAKFFGDLAQGFREAGRPEEVEEKVSLACFIPAYSALGYPVRDAYTFKPDDLKPEQIKFDDWYVSRTNDPHATVDKGIKEWVLQRLLGRDGKDGSSAGVAE